MSHLFVLLLSMNVYRGLLIIFIFIACSNDEVTDDPTWIAVGVVVGAALSQRKK